MRLTKRRVSYNQYYRIVNLTKREYLDGNDFGQGLSYEALEYGDRGALGATLLLLKTHWKNDVIVLGSDYWPLDEYEEIISTLVPDLFSSQTEGIYEYSERFTNAEPKARIEAEKLNINLNRTISLHPYLQEPGDKEIYVLYCSETEEYIDPNGLGDSPFYANQICSGSSGGMLTGLLKMITFAHSGQQNKKTWATKPITLTTLNNLPDNAIDISSYLRQEMSEDLIRYRTLEGGLIIRGIPKYNLMVMKTLVNSRKESLMQKKYRDTDFIWTSIPPVDSDWAEDQ